MKRSPLRPKHSSSLKRSAGITRGKLSKRTSDKDRREASKRIERTELKRTKGIAAASAKKRARRREEARVRAEVFERDGWCQFPHYLHPEVPCMGGLTFHHLRKAAQGGSYCAENGLTLCAVSNDWVETEPDAARALGLVIRRGDVA